MSAPKPTQAEIDELLAKHGGELVEVETEELYALARRPSRDEFAAWMDGKLTNAGAETAHNNLLCACLVWPPVADWQAAIEACPGLLPRFGDPVADMAFPDGVLQIAPGEAIPKEHGAAIEAARAKGAALFTVAAGRVLGFKRPGRFEYEACSVAIREGRQYEGAEALALRCVVEPSKDVLKEFGKEWPGVVFTAGLGVYNLGQHKGSVRAGKLRASSQ